jgi:choline dehydrogenase-like flavoprotein
MVDFGYVIVGAAAAGCVLASQLSENPGNQVLLLEYGGHDTNPMLYVPEGSISRCGAAAIATIPRPGRSVPTVSLTRRCPSRSPATPRPPRWRSPGSPPASSAKTHR